MQLEKTVEEILSQALCTKANQERLLHMKTGPVWIRAWRSLRDSTAAVEKRGLHETHKGPVLTQEVGATLFAFI